jgi:hypothetical protein
MKLSARYLVLLAAASLGTPIFAHAQAEQVLKDAFVATGQTIFEADPDDGLSPPKNPSDGSRSFQAMSFDEPNIGSLNGTRDLIVVDGTKILRYYNGTNDEADFPGIDTPADQNPQLLFDGSSEPSGLRYVNTVAVTPDGTALFSGYSRRKRRFELWEMDLDGSPQAREVAFGTPQLTDSVYINAADVVGATGPLTGGGLLAVADRSVLFFPAGAYGSFFTLADARNLPIRNNTKILSADLARETDWLLLTTSTRELLTMNYRTGSVSSIELLENFGVPQSCVDSRAQRVLLRNVGSAQNTVANVLTDACGQVLAYTFDSTVPGTNGFGAIAAPTTSLVALAVGEGNQVICVAGQICTLTAGYEALIQTPYDSELLVLKVNNLCDPRVDAPDSSCYDANADDTLVLNALLPQSLQDALDERDVTITIPPYMFAAAPDARFGAVFVQADEFSRDALVTARLTIEELLAPFDGLGVAMGLPRGTPLVTLLNNDVVAYAPDNPLYPTVNGFEATPVTIGSGSVAITKRGYSVDIYGLQHDLNGPSGRDAIGGGIPNGGLSNGSPPRCPLAYGGQFYGAPDDPDYYFFNLVACLFDDMESLLTGNLFSLDSTDRANLVSRLNLTKDKLIKALNATGASSGDQNFTSVLQQLDQYDAALQSTYFDPQWKIYKNDLIVRSAVFGFNIRERAAPSIPSGGF